jgi:hypothetical protein
MNGEQSPYMVGFLVPVDPPAFLFALSNLPKSEKMFE